MKIIFRKIAIFLCFTMIFCDVSSTFSKEIESGATNLKICDESKEDLREETTEEIIETFTEEREKDSIEDISMDKSINEKNFEEKIKNEENLLEEIEEETSFFEEVEEDYEEEEKEETIIENELDSKIVNEIEEETSFFEELEEEYMEEEPEEDSIIESELDAEKMPELEETTFEEEQSFFGDESETSNFEEIKEDESKNDSIDNELETAIIESDKLEEQIAKNEVNEEIIETEQDNSNNDGLLESNELINEEKLENEIVENEIIVEQNIDKHILKSPTPTTHTLNSDWLDNASTPKENVTNIYVQKGGTQPAGVEFDIDTSTGLKGYENGSDITIYAPNSEDVIQLNTNFNQFNLLESLEIEAFDTSLITDMNSMFSHCQNLVSLDLSNFDTGNVTIMYSAFSECNNLTSLDLRSFDTSQVTDMSNMFFNCNNLVSLNLSGFDTTNVIDMQNMFQFCQNLTTVYVSNDFDTSNVINSNDMFYECSSIIGGNSTTYDSSHIDVEYARIDAVGTPGYFTSSTYTVTFNTNGGSSIASVDVYDGDLIIKPTDPIKVGFEFVDWYKESTLTNEWDFTSDIVTANTTLYAKWIAVYTITFNTNGGSSIESVDVHDGDLITRPTNPTKAGYEFVDWYKEPTLTNEWDFTSDIVTVNTTLYAKWEVSSITTYTVTFDTNGGSSIAQVEVNEGETISKPVNPTKSGYTFIKWYKEFTFVNAWNFTSDIVTSNMTLYAKWSKNSSSGNGGGGGGGDGGSPKYNAKGEIIGPSGKSNYTIVASQSYLYPVRYVEQGLFLLSDNVVWKHDSESNLWKLNIDKNNLKLYAMDTYVTLFSLDANTNFIKLDFYRFDDRGNMLLGWIEDQKREWYYFEPTQGKDFGKLTIGWKEIGKGNWYYFNYEGKLLVNGVTPDGQFVGTDGLWVDPNRTIGIMKSIRP